MPADKEKAKGKRAERKRAQNRISQQCLREKRAARARDLDSFNKMIASSSLEGDNSDQYLTLLQNHMTLLEEKSQLEEVIFRMRKKLLSLSNLASSAADDEALDALWNKKRRRSEDESSQPFLMPDGGLAKEESPSKRRLPGQEAPLPSPAAACAEKASERPCPTKVACTGVDKKSSQSRIPVPSCEFPANLCSAGGASLPVETRLKPHSAAEDTLPTLLSGLEECESSEGPLNLSLTWTDLLANPFSPGMPPLEDRVTITSGSFYIEKIVQACQKYMQGMLASQLNLNPTVAILELGDESWDKDGPKMHTATKLSEIAVCMLSFSSGLNAFLYGVNAAFYMELILRWRILPSATTRLAIPVPFSPTPLQYSSTDYPLSIDFINWPTIRDQLILQSRTINVDAIVRDVILNTVIEVHQLRAAFNVFDLFHTHILRSALYDSAGELAANAILDSDWKFIDILVGQARTSASEDSDLTGNAILNEVMRRMRDQIGEPSSSSELSTAPFSRRSVDVSPDHPVSGAHTFNIPQLAKHESPVTSDMNQVPRWKLSKDFARKYPFLDCTCAVSAYDMVAVKNSLCGAISV